MNLEEVDIKSDHASAKFVPKLSMQEYFIDILGGLVPGILFLMGNCFIIFPSVYALSCSLSEKGSKDSFPDYFGKFLSVTKDTPSAFWIVMFLILFFLAYTIGHIFYRHDPAVPDQKGIELLKKNMLKKYKQSEKKYGKNINIENDNVFKNKIRSQLACDKKDDQFPYPFYNLYLEERGLKYLSEFVLWNEENRSKTYINLFKTRLMYHYPDKCGTIIRNEAHVRLASSTWYVARFLQYFGFSGFILALFSLFLSVNYSQQFETYLKSLSWYIIPLFLPLLVSAFSAYFYISIPAFIHYQRLREVFYVLDTYCIAFQENPDLMKVPINHFMEEIIKDYKNNINNIKIFSKHARYRYHH